MTHGSLFSGIGGFDLAAEWSGWENLFNCEWEEFPRKVLKHHFPNAKQYEDIKDFNATDYNGRIDVLSGGFPCQPFSTAGLRKGTEDERHLWPEMLRIIGECQPRWVVGENVRGLVSWSDGLVFETCCTDLEAIGYSVQSFIIPACATGAPHRRDRVWIVAHSNNIRSNKPKESAEQQGRTEIRTTSAKSCGMVAKNSDRDGRGSNKRKEEPNFRGFGDVSAGDNERIQPNHEEAGNATDTERVRLEHSENNGEMGGRPKKTQGEGGKFTHEPKTRREVSDWEAFPTVSPVRGRNDGLPKELDGITFSKWRKESIKAYGNAIVPQVAHRIFESINDYENDTN